MKVLKQPDTNWTMKWTCAYCDAELEVEKSDVKWHHYSGDQREPSYDSYTAQCAVCHHEFAILEDKLGKAVKLEIQRGQSGK